MDIQSIVQLISTLGFPIFCCLYLFWHDNKLNDQHREEVNKLVEIINNNTIALTKLTDRIDNIETKVSREG